MKFQLEKEKNARTEEALRLSSERNNLDSTYKGIEMEFGALQKRNHEVEGMLADQEQGHAHRILELTSRHRQVLTNNYIYSCSMVIFRKPTLRWSDFGRLMGNLNER